VPGPDCARTISARRIELIIRAVLRADRRR